MVNTIGCDLALEIGALSMAIFQAAGHTVQNEIDKNQPNGIQHWEFVISKGGNLVCDRIYHAALDDYDASSNNSETVRSHHQHIVFKGVRGFYVTHDWAFIFFVIYY